jgi:UDP-N-acetylmuramyl pentapeptide phosphotransferase/UDP-N-acetylglucosamine-1-phosphate transferase
MPVWVWVLLGLTALGFVLWLLDDRMGLDATERFGKALAILFILAVLGGLVLSFVNADWR